jgi:flavin reductase (DIM6/NTAB) family NADH-FMN oxidoreductase RutF
MNLSIYTVTNGSLRTFEKTSNGAGGKTGSPIIKDCIAWFECEVVSSLAPGNHTLFIGKVVNAKVVSENSPMSTADYDGTYTGRS